MRNTYFGLQNWLYLVPVNERENFTTNDRYNTGVASGSEGNDKCVEELSGKDEALFVALVDKYDDGSSFEEIDIRITNPNYSDSTFFTNKLNDIYNNRKDVYNTANYKINCSSLTKLAVVKKIVKIYESNRN